MDGGLIWLVNVWLPSVALAIEFLGLFDAKIDRFDSILTNLLLLLGSFHINGGLI